MDSDFIERLQMFNLTEEEGEAITVCSDHREKILEEVLSVSLVVSTRQNPSPFERQKFF